MSIELWRALSPHTVERMREIEENCTKFVHYTSAATALSIFQKKEVWMRSAAEMNDFSEVQHGQGCIAYAWNKSNHGTRLKAMLESIQAGLVKRIEEAFDKRRFHREKESYLISVSEHGGSVVNEDKYGRLSMWRAYGGDTNVALVMENGPFMRESSALTAFTSPVIYKDREMFLPEFGRVVDRLEDNLEAAKALGGDEINKLFDWILHCVALSVKHPGFAEEREWRVIHSPTLFPSDKLKYGIENIGGVPQRVYKFPLQDFPDQGFYGATLPDLLSEVIIGPTTSAYTIYDALVDALEQAGVENADEKVRISDIPLRR